MKRRAAICSGDQRPRWISRNPVGFAISWIRRALESATDVPSDYCRPPARSRGSSCPSFGVCTGGAAMLWSRQGSCSGFGVLGVDRKLSRAPIGMLTTRNNLMTRGPPRLCAVRPVNKRVRGLSSRQLLALVIPVVILRQRRDALLRFPCVLKCSTIKRLGTSSPRSLCETNDRNAGELEGCRRKRTKLSRLGKI